MKRIVAFTLSVLMLGLCFVNIVSAQTTAESYKVLGDNAVSYTCNYNEDMTEIEINGSVNYDMLATYSKYIIEVYRVMPNQSFDEVISSESPALVASMAIAMRFHLSFSATSIMDKFCKYAVALRSPEGEVILTSAPRYISVGSSYDYTTHRNAFKGISTVSDVKHSIYGDFEFGTAIIPVFYDELIDPSSNGYIYPHEDDHIFFDKAYIDELQAKIRAYSSSGARVYLQLLLPSGTMALSGSDGQVVGAKYDMPDVYSVETAAKISTFVKYFATRFDSYTEGHIAGFIVGDKIDEFKSNYCGDIGIDAYAEKYAFYLTLVANSARFENPELDIVIPISGVDTYSADKTPRSDGFDTSELLEGISATLNSGLYDHFDCSIMLISDVSPINIVPNAYGNMECEVKTDTDGKIGANNIETFIEFLNGLKGKYRSAPDNCIFMWQIPESLKGNGLAAAYVYSYYRLFSAQMISAFVVSFDECENGAFEYVRKNIDTIDTKDGLKENKYLLQYFLSNSWTDVITDFSDTRLVLRKAYLSDNEGLSAREWKGSFTYLDFASGNVSGWSGISYSKNLKSDYSTDGRRALRYTARKTDGEAYAQLLHLYEYDENYAYTPAIRLEVEITDSGASDGALYEIVVTIGTDKSSVKETYVVRSGELTQLWFDMSEYNSLNKASYIKINTRSITGESEDYSLWLFGISGYSEIYDDATLESLINEERSKIRDDGESADEGISDNRLYWIVFFIIIIAALIAGGMYILLRRDEGGRRRRLKKGIIDPNSDTEKDKEK